MLQFRTDLNVMLPLKWHRCIQFFHLSPQLPSLYFPHLSPPSAIIVKQGWGNTQLDDVMTMISLLKYCTTRWGYGMRSCHFDKQILVDHYLYFHSHRTLLCISASPRSKNSWDFLSGSDVSKRAGGPWVLGIPLRGVTHWGWLKSLK